MAKAKKKAARRPSNGRAKKQVSAAEQVQEKLAETLAADGWLVAMFCVDGDRIKLSRHSHHFPIADFETAIDLLENDLRQAAVNDVLAR